MNFRNNYRWYGVASLLAIITAINYVDRQTLAILITAVKADIPISETQYGRMTSMFLVGYALMYLGGGWLVDRVGVRWGYVLIAGGWSLACAAHSLVATASGMIAARFMLGFTEGGGFPASTKAVSEWFAPKERAFAIGIFNTGSAIGSTIAPPLVAGLALTFGWRSAFLAAGIVGIAWAIVWGFFYRPVQQSKRVSEQERSYLIQEGVGKATDRHREPWINLLRVRETWVLIVARLLTGGPWFFMIFWFPKYLADEWGFNTQQIGWFAWLPYAFAGIGSFFGGMFSSWLMNRGHSLNSARKWSLACSASFLPAAIVIAFSPQFSSSPFVAIAFACLAFLGHQFWSVILHTLTTDLYPSRMVGSAAGLIGMAEAGGSALFAELIGRVLEATSRDYTFPFIITGSLHPIACVMIFLWIPKIGLIKRFEHKEDRVSE